MKEVKYIPGDLVMTDGVSFGTDKGIIYQVVESAPSKEFKLQNGKVLKGTVNIDVVEGYNKDNFVGTAVWIKHIVPINLTIEILEKNGWRLVNHRVDVSGFEWKDYSREDGFVDVEYYPESNNFAAFYCGQELRDIKYVHELQHILWALNENSQLKP